MAKKRLYIFDRGDVSVRKDKFSFLKIVWTGIKVFLASVSLFTVLYLILSIFLSTDTERRLRRENRMFEKTLPTMRPREQLLGDVISGLQRKDGDIYTEVFHTDAPSLDPISSLDFLFGADSIPDDKVVSYAFKKIRGLEVDATDVNESFGKIYSGFTNETVLPPMSMPVKNISFTQIGASVGKKMNPLLKAEVNHRGLDIIVPQGTPVYVPAAGTVTRVVNSYKGEGKTVTVEHAGGYVTRYLHLSDIKVVQGQRVAKGAKIGETGMSGAAFAPHLHYEVLQDGKVLNPINFFFADVDADEYSNMLFMSINTRQSMD